MHDSSTCPGCEGRNLYRSNKPISSGGGYAPNYLPGLGPRFKSARVDVIVCADCGLTRAFATEDARRKLHESAKWTRVY